MTSNETKFDTPPTCLHEWKRQESQVRHEDLETAQRRSREAAIRQGERAIELVVERMRNLSQIRPMQHVVYHVGHLFTDRGGDGKDGEVRPTTELQEHVNRIANMADRMFAAGRVTLYQRPAENGQGFEYVAKGKPQ